MNWKSSVILISAILLGCDVNVHTAYDRQTDFDKYKTFCWMSGCEFKFDGPNYLNDSLLRESLRVSIIEELESKGLTMNSDNPDLLVGLTVTIKDEKAIVYHPSENMPFYQPLTNDRKEVTYLKGTLVIGLVDRRESKVVWESFAESYTDLDPDFSKKNVHKTIKYVLKEYPPPRK
jgi:hypothetical protein